MRRLYVDAAGYDTACGDASHCTSKTVPNNMRQPTDAAKLGTAYSGVLRFRSTPTNMCQSVNELDSEWGDFLHPLVGRRIAKLSQAVSSMTH